MGNPQFLSCERKSSLVCPHEQTSSGWFLARGAGDAALDPDGEAFRPESDQGFCIDEHHCPRSLSRCKSTHPVKGRAWRHRLLRTSVGSTFVAPPQGLKPPRDA